MNRQIFSTEEEISVFFYFFLPVIWLSKGYKWKLSYFEEYFTELWSDFAAYLTYSAWAVFQLNERSLQFFAHTSETEKLMWSLKIDFDLLGFQKLNVNFLNEWSVGYYAGLRNLIHIWYIWLPNNTPIAMQLCASIKCFAYVCSTKYVSKQSHLIYVWCVVNCCLR